LRWSSTTLSAALAASALAGCGLAVRSPDLFVLTRNGPRGTLTILINDAGTIRCDNGQAQSLPDRSLIVARDLATNLSNDAKAGLKIAATASSVYTYTVRMQDGTIAFPDSAAARHTELGPLEQFALQQAEGLCEGARGSAS
jgi:hypothetical protein